MKTKTPKARVMWANYYPKFVGAPSIYADKERAEQAAANCTTPIRVAVIPLDDLAGIAERARSAFWGSGPQGTVRDIDGIRAALTAAGIPCRKASK